MPGAQRGIALPCTAVIVIAIIIIIIIIIVIVGRRVVTLGGIFRLTRS